MKRHHDWPSRLDAYLRATKRTPFAWGSNDCCEWAANAVRAMRDLDLLDWARGRYTDESGALAVLREYVDAAGPLQAGGDRGQPGEQLVPGMMDRLAATHALPAIGKTYAQRGDLALLPEPPGVDLFGGALGIVVGSKVLVMQGAGLTAWNAAHIVKAWRI